MTESKSPPNPAFKYALRQALMGLRSGQKHRARRWAQQAAALDPDREEPWLILAAVGSAEASIHYLEKALEINPGSPRARKGMHWAIQRLRAQAGKAPSPKPGIKRGPRIERSTRPQRRRANLLPIIAALVFMLLITGGWVSSPLLAQALAAPEFAAASLSSLLQPSPTEAVSATPVPTETATSPPPSETPTASVTALPSLTPLPTSTPTRTPTNTLTPTPTDTPLPTNTPTLVPTPLPPTVYRPEGVGANENWIDIDLTNQILHAYTGDTLVRSFIVSTGTWQTPTVTGTYRVYVKYRYADMSGPGYYLANVPYVMYFYQGYGIHGTYWHNNFGTPMSHGCINMTIDDSGWVYAFSVIGTVVNIHY